MINNFEEITQELSDTELTQIVPAIVKGLKKRIGKDNAITNKAMIEGLKSWKNIITTEARIRKIIHYIRISGEIERLMATSKGYYISNNKNELKLYIEGLHQRVESISQIANQLEFQLKKIQ